MKIDRVDKNKKNLRITLFINIFVTILIIVSGYLMSDYRNSLSSRQLSVQAGILSARKNLADLKTELNEIDMASKIWEKSKELNEKHNGLRLDEAESIIKFFETKYDILNLQTKVSPPSIFDKLGDDKNSVIMFSEVTLNFAAISDENILQFIDAILNNFPGFKLVRSLKIVKNSQITESLLKKIENDEKPPVVTAELVFDWRDFKEMKEL